MKFMFSQILLPSKPRQKRSAKSEALCTRFGHAVFQLSGAKTPGRSGSGRNGPEYDGTGQNGTACVGLENYLFACLWFETYWAGAKRSGA